MSEFSSNSLEKIINKLNKYDDKDIKKLMNYYIRKVNNKALNMNFDTDTIGYKSDINRFKHDITNLNEINEVHISGSSFWIGFIPKFMKIVYSFDIKNYAIANHGHYFYMDDYSYIYEFAKYIKGKKINNDYAFLIQAHDFIYNYFFTIYNPIKDMQLHHLIYKDNDTYYKPIKEHSILDFKGNNAAECAEYSALLQNILCVFGYESVYLHGFLENSWEGKEENTAHAFNLAVINNLYTILDVASTITCFNETLRTKKRFPYIFEMENFNEDDLDNFLVGNNKLELDDLETHIINNKYYTFSRNRKRSYSVDPMTFD